MTVPEPGKARIILEPHGLIFLLPSKLEMRTYNASVELLNPSSSTQDPIGVYWFNEGSGMWEYQPGSGSVNGDIVSASTSLNHFSRYALGGDKPSRD
jgi:hypothetical protein